jgi:hypothetical protein
MSPTRPNRRAGNVPRNADLFMLLILTLLIVLTVDDLSCHASSYDRGMADDEKPDDVPWYSAGYAASMQSKGCTPRPREHVWTLVKGARCLDASLLFGGETFGWELRVIDGGDPMIGSRFPLKAGAQAEADALREQYLRNGSMPPTTSHATIRSEP